MQMVVFLYPGMTALDLIGPHELLSRIPDTTVKVVAETVGPVKTDTGIELVAEYSIDQIDSADLLLIPGGSETLKAMESEATLAWLRKIDATTQRTASVCTGSLLLAAAGLLHNRQATTHWAMRETLAELGAEVSTDRVVESGKYITAAGVSAGIDMGLTLLAQLAGEDFAQLLQLVIEYQPEPPFNAGSPETAPAHIMQLALQRRAETQ
ncbi:DJ-1/PfpI family protein [Pseudomaricurvus alkylphenolicus]|jgi:transcriptional regulator GlxA family with amidase domain|uniref:DJ-1/PfpI family protein n=1 Tax=Pseudomaricurvus alkylphenolicus TaxID=1306991 RepID=UPI0014241D44|nr:DJ-1/PfpI family protein [Pseudomaricurvus alkylphenolicus]NIB43621.1 DJ-1/PfpI family protein [Pseudomaricurvus alkylphenolicus]